MAAPALYAWRVRIRSALAVVVGATTLALGAPGAASADLPAAFTGPSWFTGGQPPATSTWKWLTKGSTIANPPADSYVPAGISSGQGPYSEAHNAEGLFTPTLKGGLGFNWFSKASTVIADAGVFIVTRPYRYVLTPLTDADKLYDSFTVYRLDFAGGDALAGEYYTCGPTAFARNGPGSNGDFYYEGRVRIQRSTEPGAVPTPPDSTQLYGYDGLIGGESPLCDVARAHPELFTPFDGGPSTNPSVPTGETRRASATALSCNRGPNPGDPFDCTVIVGDNDGRPGATAPTGTVQLTANDGSLGAASCALTSSPTTPAISRCGPIAYTNATLGAGNRPPITAVYLGSAVHEGSTGDTTSPTPTGPPPGTPIVCGASPLPACEGLVPGSDPVQTCVANVIGSCTNLPPLSPLTICIGNVGASCTASTTGAKLAGVWDTTKPETEVEVGCPDTSGASARAQDPPEGTEKPGGKKPDVEFPVRACLVRVNMSADERLVVELFDAAFRGEVGRRAAAYSEIQALKKREPTGAGRFPNRFTVEEILTKSLLASVRDHNSRLSVVNAAVSTITPSRRRYLRIGLLKPINVNVPLGQFSLESLHPADGKPYREAQKGKPQLRATAAKKKYGPSRTGVKYGQITVASYSGTVAAGKRATVKVKLTKAARALLKLYAVAGKTSIPLTTTVALESTSNAFSPSTKTTRTTVKLKKPKKKRK